MSIVSGVVPRMFTPAFFRLEARFSGVWPPNWAITPSGFSFSLNAQHVLEREGLEIELVGGVIVGGNRFPGCS